MGLVAVAVPTLDQLPLRDPRVITGFSAEDPALVARLVEMGFDEGMTVEVTDRAAGGDPIAVRIGATKVALRRALAAHITTT
mgnify:CR=1 FL=1